MTKSTTENKSGMIPIDKAAQLLMVTPTYVRQLCRSGVIPKPSRGMVPLVAAVQGYIRWLKDEERRTSKTAEAAAVHRARAREIELRIAREEGKLVETSDAETAFANILGAWRVELAGLSAAVTRDLTQRRKIDDYIEAAVARARAKFSAERQRLVTGDK